jgi:hypothetical protein
LGADTGGFKNHLAYQFLNHTNIGAISQQVSGVRASESAAGGPLVQPSTLCVRANELFKRCCTHLAEAFKLAVQIDISASSFSSGEEDLMPYKIDFAGPYSPIIITVIGKLTAEDVAEILEQIVSSEDYPANINAIYDFTQMSFENITSDFLKSLDYQIQRGNHKRVGAKTAYVCPEDLKYGMIRVWEALIDDLKVETLVTRSMEEALSWVNFEPRQSY